MALKKKEKPEEAEIQPKDSEDPSFEGAFAESKDKKVSGDASASTDGKALKKFDKFKKGN